MATRTKSLTSGMQRNSARLVWSNMCKIIFSLSIIFAMSPSTLTIFPGRQGR